MRILSISRGLETSPHAGGEYISATRITRALAERGHDVTLLAPGTADTQPPFEGADVRTVTPCRRSHLPFRMWRTLRAAGDLDEFDAIVAHGGEGFCFAAARRFRGGKPLVTFVHTPKLKRAALLHSRWLAYQQYTAAWADRVVCLSQYQATRVSETYAIDAARVDVIGAGVAPNFFDVPERPLPNGSGRDEPLQLLIVGDQSHAKGFDLVLETLARLRSRMPLQAQVVGSSDDPLANAHTAELTRRLGLQDVVRFHGQIPHEAMTEHYRRSDVFLQPSRRETFGLAVLEAMATGLPCVVLRRGSVPEVVGDAALVVEDECPEQLADAVLSLQDPVRRRALGQQARRQAAGFGHWSEAAGRLHEILGEVTRKAPSGARLTPATAGRSPPAR